jgi:HD superfamily phosphohydrolase
MSSSLTFTDKEIRKYEKKARQNEQKYKGQGDTKYLQERDKFLDKALKLRDNRLVDRKRDKRKVAESQKTDDQLLNEAIRQRRREKNDAEKKRKIQMEKEANLKELRCSVKRGLREKDEEKIKFIKAYREEEDPNKPKKPDSQVEKMFTLHYKNQVELVKWKNKMISFFMSLGMNEEDALNELQKMIDAHLNNGMEDPIPEEEEQLCIDTPLNENPRL